MSREHPSQTNRLLGYSDDARLLLVNADDFGMYPAINGAVVRAFQAGIVQSTSLMVPCPGAAQAAQLVRDNPEIHFGVHLSVIRDIEQYRWGPLAPMERVPSLLDEGGSFYSTGRMSEMLGWAKLEELEVEFRAQIEAVLGAGLAPTHLDWHCLRNGGREDIFDLTLGLAQEYRLALRAASPPYTDRLRRQGLPMADYDLLDSFTLSLDEKPARYTRMLRALPAGLSEWAVHPSLGDPESRALDPNGWRVRRTDLDFLVSPLAREVIQEEGIILLGYAPLQRIWYRGPS
jgi:chitin disaccharide deacetylase